MTRNYKWDPILKHVIRDIKRQGHSVDGTITYINKLIIESRKLEKKKNILFLHGIAERITNGDETYYDDEVIFTYILGAVMKSHSFKNHGIDAIFKIAKRDEKTSLVEWMSNVCEIDITFDSYELPHI
jgi:hypothetical protein